MRFKKHTLFCAVTLSALGAAASFAGPMTPTGHAGTISPDGIAFKDAPGLPKGAQIAVIHGNPNEAGPYTMRMRLPNCYVIPAHWHTNDEEVTVLLGSFHVGLGDKIDKANAVTLSAGGYQLVPGRANHYVWSTGTTMIQISGIGPRDTTFADPNELIPLFHNNTTCP